MSSTGRPFETLFGYAVYNGFVIDRAWDECTFSGEDDADPWPPSLKNILIVLAERWRKTIAEAPALSSLVSRFRRMPPDGSLRDAPEAFNGLSSDEQELVVFAIHDSLLRWMAMDLMAHQSHSFRKVLQDTSLLEAAQNAYQVLFGMHCHTGQTDAGTANKLLNAIIDEMQRASGGVCNITSEPDRVEISRPSRFEEYQSIAGEDLKPLIAAAWRYESAAKAGQRYLTVALSFDGNSHTRSELVANIRRFVAAAVTSNSSDRFNYLWKAMLSEAAAELAWVPPQSARRLISQAAADDAVVRRCVRVLSMVHELHKAGYQRLRVLPFLAPSGCYWRACITPSDNVAVDGYTLIDWDPENSGQRVAKYTSAQGSHYFDWKDAADLGARQLASLFLERFPKICEQSVGLDWAYAGWLTDVLGNAECLGGDGGLIYLLHDGEVDPEYMRRWQPPPPIRGSKRG